MTTLTCARKLQLNFLVVQSRSISFKAFNTQPWFKETEVVGSEKLGCAILEP